MRTALRWTSADLVVLPDDGKRYEIIDGELYMSRQPHWHHQLTCSNLCANLCAELRAWSLTSGMGQATITPDILFSEADNVIADVVWISNERLTALMDEAGHLTG